MWVIRCGLFAQTITERRVMRESQIWRLINTIQKPYRDWHLIRIESSTINGIPDVNACIEGNEFWFELKSNDDKNYGISKYQINWIIKRQRAGGKAFILHNSPLKREFKILEIRDSGLPVPVSRFPYTKPATILPSVLIELAQRAQRDSGLPFPV